VTLNVLLFFCRLVAASGGDVSVSKPRTTSEVISTFSTSNDNGDSQAVTADSVAIAIRPSMGSEEVKEKTKAEIKAEKEEEQKEKKELAKYTKQCVKRIWGMHTTHDYMCYAGGKRNPHMPHTVRALGS
jgi:hypothetical protein